MKNYTIAVVVPAYNAERYIGEALDSVAAQTRPPEEVIVVDDGSVDGTVERVLCWQRENFPGLILLKQNNRGVSAARNTGLRHAKADLLTFLDADDLLFPDHLERLESGFKRHRELLICFGDALYFNSERIIKDSSLVGTRIESVQYHEEDDGLRLMRNSAYASLLPGNYVSLSASLLSRRALERVGVFDEAIKSAEDRHLFLRLSRIGQFAYYPCVVAQKRVHDNNLTHPRHISSSNRYKLMVLEKMRDNADAMKLSAEEKGQTRAALGQHVWNMLMEDLRAGPAPFVKALKHLIGHGYLATVCNPTHFTRAVLSYWRAKKRQRVPR